MISVLNISGATLYTSMTTVAGNEGCVTPNAIATGMERIEIILVICFSAVRTVQSQ